MLLPDSPDGRRNAAQRSSLQFLRQYAPEWSLLLLVIGARLAVFDYAGSPLPFYDQWLAEFNNMLLRLVQGEGPHVLFDRHNEHLLVTTKLLTLIGYKLNGYWDVRFLVVCGAVIRAATAAGTLRLISDSSSARAKMALWLLCAATFALPFSGYNLLSGMQVSFFLVDCALLMSLHAVCGTWRPVTRVLLLVGSCVFGLLSMGAALAIPAATLACYVCQRRVQREFWPAWIVCAAITIIFTIVMVASAEPHPWSWSTVPSIVHFWLGIISWPLHSAWIGVGVVVVAGCAVLFVVRSRPDRVPGAPILAGLGAYAAVNAALVAFARYPEALHNRHWDALAWGMILAAAVRWVAHRVPSPGARLVLAAAGVAYLAQFGHLIATTSWPYLKAAHETRDSALAYYRQLLSRGDLRAECLRMNDILKRRDYSFFDDPIGRFSLHPSVSLSLVYYERKPLSMLSPDIVPGRKRSAVTWICAALIRGSWMLAAVAASVGGFRLYKVFRRDGHTGTNHLLSKRDHDQEVQSRLLIDQPPGTAPPRAAAAKTPAKR